MGKKKPSKKNNLSFNYPDLKNSFNTLLANIRFASIDKPIKSIAITSVGMDEGKTTVAANLALSIANSGKTCLLVDCDMRKRSIAKMINVHPKFGIYSLLTGRCRVEEAISATPFENFYFLDCEPKIPNPSDVLSTKRFAAFVDYVYNKYDYIIFDTPPLVSFVDGALVGALVDATLLVVREGKAKKADVANTVTQLKQAKANILGTVLTFSTDTTESDYYYAYYNKEGKRVSKRSANDPSIEEENISSAEAHSNLHTWLDTGEAEGKASEKHKSMINDQESEGADPDDTNPLKPVKPNDEHSFNDEAHEYFAKAKHRFKNSN